MTAYRQSFGRWGENLAAQYLTQQGYEIIGRNARTPYGEIDLVARFPGGEIVFVEVKTRRSEAYGLPEDAITASKRQHLMNSCLYYIQQHCELPDQWRIDVIAVQRTGQKQPPVITHFENAIT